MGWLLLSIGAILELVGVVLVAAEIVDRRRQVQAYEGEPLPKMQVTASRKTGGPSTPPLKHPAFTVDQRLARIELLLTQLPRDLARTQEAAVTEAGAATDRRIREVAQVLRAEHGRTTRLLLGTVKDTRKPIASIVCLVFGMILQFIGGILNANPGC